MNTDTLRPIKIDYEQISLDLPYPSRYVFNIQHSTMLNARLVGRSAEKFEGWRLFHFWWWNTLYFITEALINTVLSQCAKHSMCSVLRLKHAQIQWLIQMGKYNNPTRKSFHIYRRIVFMRIHRHMWVRRFVNIPNEFWCFPFVFD